MAAGYVLQWMPLLDAIKHIHRVAGGTLDEACDKLLETLREGAVVSLYRGRRYRGRGIGGIAASIEGGGVGVPPARWYGATVFNDGGVEFSDTSHNRLLRRFDRLPNQIEIQRSDLLRWWPEPVITAAKEPVKPASTRRPPSRLKPFWAPAGKLARQWLEDNGCPVAGDGEQAKLQAYISGWLADRGHHPVSSTIRNHVRIWIEEYRNILNS